MIAVTIIFFISNVDFIASSPPQCITLTFLTRQRINSDSRAHFKSIKILPILGFHYYLGKWNSFNRYLTTVNRHSQFELGLEILLLLLQQCYYQSLSNSNTEEHCRHPGKTKQALLCQHTRRDKSIPFLVFHHIFLGTIAKSFCLQDLPYIL